MKRNNFFSRFIVVTLTAALLLVSGGRAIRVSALADPDWQMMAELAPVFDTQIIQLQDYIQNNVTQPQFEIFNILLGLYVAAQGGFSEYQLHDPYTTQDGILGWLKSCGIQLYNSLIGMNAIGVDPITGIDYRPFIKGAADIAMGCAVKSTQYTDANDFISDVNVQEKYFLPLDSDIQGSLNYIFSRNNGLYNWQFSQSEWESNIVYRSVVLPPTSPYWTLIVTLNQPLVRFNAGWANEYSNGVVSSAFFDTYHNFFLNTSDGHFYILDDNGDPVVDTNNNFYRYDISVRELYYDTSNSNTTIRNNSIRYLVKNTYVTLDSYQDIVQYYCDHPELFTGTSSQLIFITDYIKHWYYGSSWSNKTEIFHTTDLNLDENTLPYYQQVGNNYLLDIKGILQNLLNTVDLKDVVLNNIYDLTGLVVTDPVLTQVAIEILQEIQTINVPIPVNLNDVAEYTDNTYLDVVKERATSAGSTLANLVAFWHNCDAELIYALFGAGIMVLIGAFIGKWGHS